MQRIRVSMVRGAKASLTLLISVTPITISYVHAFPRPPEPGPQLSPLKWARSILVCLGAGISQPRFASFQSSKILRLHFRGGGVLLVNVSLSNAAACGA